MPSTLEVTLFSSSTSPSLTTTIEPSLSELSEMKSYKGGGQAFFRVIISFGLGPPEVAPYMTGTFGEVFGPRNQTGSEPRPARK
mgnify:CR=1 FL=1